MNVPPESVKVPLTVIALALPVNVPAAQTKLLAPTVMVNAF